MTTLILNNQFKQFDLNGVPLAAGKIYTYVVGTTDDKLTYQDEAKVAEHTNPIILDALGEATIWIDGDTKFVVTDSDGVTIRTYPSFADTVVTGEFPVVSSPQGAVLRSTTTDTGYIKIQLPMGEWPNTKMMFDVMVYTDDADEAFTLTLGGYADSNTSAWLTTTAITNGITDYTVQFGNDGTYPAIYIGAVDSEWVKPQIAVTNFLAGEFSYDWDTWDNGWAVTVTTSLGTITSTDTALKKITIAQVQAITDILDADLQPQITANAGDITDVNAAWASAWVEATLTADFTQSASNPLRYRKIINGNNLQLSGEVEVVTGSLSGPTIFTLPSGYRPTFSNPSLQASAIEAISIESSGACIYLEATTTIGRVVRINIIIPLN